RISEHGRHDAPAHAGFSIRRMILSQPLVLGFARSREAGLERIERRVFGHRRLGCVVGIVRHGGRTGPVARNNGNSRGNGYPIRPGAAPLERGWVRVNGWTASSVSWPHRRALRRALNR